MCELELDTQRTIATKTARLTNCGSYLDAGLTEPRFVKPSQTTSRLVKPGQSNFFPPFRGVGHPAGRRAAASRPAASVDRSHLVGVTDRDTYRDWGVTGTRVVTPGHTQSHPVTPSHGNFF